MHAIGTANRSTPGDITVACLFRTVVSMHCARQPGLGCAKLKRHLGNLLGTEEHEGLLRRVIDSEKSWLQASKSWTTAHLDKDSSLHNRGPEHIIAIEESVVECDRSIGGARGVDAAENQLHGRHFHFTATVALSPDKAILPGRRIPVAALPETS